MQSEGRRVPNRNRFENEKVRNALRKIDNYYDIYTRVISRVEINEAYIKKNDIFPLSLLFIYFDTKITNEEYAKRLSRMIKEFCGDDLENNDINIQDNEQNRLNKISLYLDMMTYFRNASLDNLRANDFSDNDTFEILMSIFLIDTFDDMYSLYPKYVSTKLRNTVENCFAEDVLKIKMEFQTNRALNDLSDIEIDFDKYTGKSVSDLIKPNQVYDYNGPSNKKKEDLQTYKNAMYLDYKETRKGIVFEVNKFIYDEYMATKDLNYNKLSKEMASRLDGIVSMFKDLRDPGNTDELAYNKLGLPEWYLAYYIDGKPIVDFVPSKYLRDQNAISRYCARLILKTAVKGNNIVEKVVLADCGGKIGINVQPFYLKSRINQNMYEQTFTKTRRFFSNLRMFKIKQIDDVITKYGRKYNEQRELRREQIENYINDTYLKARGLTYTTINLKENDVPYALKGKQRNARLGKGMITLDFFDIKGQVISRGELEDDLKDNLDTFKSSSQKNNDKDLLEDVINTEVKPSKLEEDLKDNLEEPLIDNNIKNDILNKTKDSNKIEK